MTTVPMPAVDLPPDWTLLDRTQTRAGVRLRLAGPGSGSVELTLSRTLATTLSDAYPVSAHDVHMEIGTAELPEADFVRLLRDVVVAVEANDPRCRRLVYPVLSAELDTRAAAEKAGFRFVVEVDVGDRELSLMVAEPDWVTRVDMELDRVPGS
jgi:hypothetical protein